jgi:hypothetical protein
MAVKTKTQLKEYFNDGDVPVESNYVDLIDTMGDMNKATYDPDGDGKVVSAVNSDTCTGANMLKSVYDANNDGRVAAADHATSATSATSATNAGNADTLGTRSPSVSVVANTIVQRHSSGYIYTNYLNMTADLKTDQPTTIAGIWGTDGFLRKVDPKNVLCAGSYVAFGSAVQIFGGSNISAGSYVSRTASTYTVPSTATAIYIRCSAIPSAVNNGHFFGWSGSNSVNGLSVLLRANRVENVDGTGIVGVTGGYFYYIASGQNFTGVYAYILGYFI